MKEYDGRLKKVREEMSNRNVDVLLVFDPVNQCYLTGYESLDLRYYRCLVIPRDGEPIMITSDFEMPGVVLTSWLKDVRPYRWVYLADPIKFTLDALKKVDPRAKRVGVEKDFSVLSPLRYESLMRMIRGMEVVNCSDIVEKLRRIKSSAEIEHVRRAARTSSLGMKAAMDTIQEGKTDNHVAAAAYKTMTDAGSDYPCDAPIVTTGPRSGIPHSTYRRVTLHKGDMIFIELGGCYCRYSAPLMRTFSLGQPPREAKINAETLIENLNRVIDTIQPGLSCDEVARKVFRQSKKPVGKNIVSSSLTEGFFGYPIGLGFPPTWGERSPAMAIGDKTTLEPGMLFHLNQTFREVGRYGLSFSETAVITKRGCEVLTEFERSFPAL
jgi:Xaa-Pro dipeptidase